MSILITGGTGSFGRAFAESALRYYERVCIYSRGELAQAKMRAEFENDGRLRWFIGDVRDRDRLNWAMRDCEVVVHAAALKRIEVGAYNPEEMVKTNVLGSMNVVACARETGVKKAVLLSTDKAWQPVSPYGYSKAMAESVFLSEVRTPTRFAVTRYGNVWGSNGSVSQRWQQPNPTLTDPECTRFYMTLAQAVSLVWQTIENMEGGELVIPHDMPAYRMGDLAEAMGIEPEIVGLPPYEKLHEGLMDGLTSDKARRMTVEELRGLLERVP